MIQKGESSQISMNTLTVKVHDLQLIISHIFSQFHIWGTARNAKHKMCVKSNTLSSSVDHSGQENNSFIQSRKISPYMARTMFYLWFSPILNGGTCEGFFVLFNTSYFLTLQKETKMIIHFFWHYSLKGGNGFPGKTAYPLHCCHIKGTSPINCFYDLRVGYLHDLRYEWVSWSSYTL